MSPALLETPRNLREAWRKTYEGTDYRRLPWFSSSPSPVVREGVQKKWFARGTRVLDIGCGAGTNCLFLAKEGYRVSGIDLAPGAIDAARERARRAHLEVDFRVGDAVHLPFPQRTFGGVNDFGCFHTLPIRLRPGYCHEVARVLRPGGTYLLSWMAREFPCKRFGPPHRPSLEEVTRVFEHNFIFRRAEYSDRGRGLPKFYTAVLERRARPQPPPM
ncbi:MAG: class I SAM-dependent methyltransferase [Thermoplasmata archaeon]